MPLEKAQAHADLARLAGVWSGTGEVFANPWGPAGKTRGEWRFRLDGGGFNLIHDYRETRDGGHVFEGHGVLTVDPDTGECVWFWFDTYGYPPLAPARGRWTGSVLVLRKVTPRGVSLSTFTLGPGALSYAVESIPTAAPPITVSSGRYVRQGAP